MWSQATPGAHSCQELEGARRDEDGLGKELGLFQNRASCRWCSGGVWEHGLGCLVRVVGNVRPRIGAGSWRRSRESLGKVGEGFEERIRGNVWGRTGDV